MELYSSGELKIAILSQIYVGLYSLGSLESLFCRKFTWDCIDWGAWNHYFVVNLFGIVWLGDLGGGNRGNSRGGQGGQVDSFSKGFLFKLST